MCLVVAKKDVKIRTLTKDKIVYKILEEINSKIAMSPFQGFTYTLGRLYEQEIEFEEGNLSCFDNQDSQYLSLLGDVPFMSFTKGFHAALKKERLNDEIIYYGDNQYLYECTIPKGAKYVIGYTDLIISNKIIIDKIFNDVKWQ